MSVRMGPDYVAALPEVPDLAGIEKGAAANQAGGDEKVAPPAAPAQFIGDSERALATVIEGEKHMASGTGELDLADELRYGHRAGNRLQMSRKLIGPQLERRRRVALKPRVGWIIGDVVIAKACHGCPRGGGAT